jgi:hypothetical protein
MTPARVKQFVRRKAADAIVEKGSHLGIADEIAWPIALYRMNGQPVVPYFFQRPGAMSEASQASNGHFRIGEMTGQIFEIRPQLGVGIGFGEYLIGFEHRD